MVDYKIILFSKKVRLLQYNSITQGIYYKIEIKNCFNDWVTPKINSEESNIKIFNKNKGIELFNYYKNIY